jgi:hypothetical protein
MRPRQTAPRNFASHWGDNAGVKDVGVVWCFLAAQLYGCGWLWLCVPSASPAIRFMVQAENAWFVWVSGHLRMNTYLYLSAV